MRNLQTSQLVIPDPEDMASSSAMVEVSRQNPLPVMTVPNVAFMGMGVQADLLWEFAKQGRIYVASDADVDDLVSGTISASFTTATTTFLLDVPEGTTAFPLFVNMQQAGTVAGGAISLFIAIDNKKRYASAGTSERIFNQLGKASACTLYSGATATVDTVSYGARVFGTVMGPDVSSAEGAITAGIWRPEVPYLLRGPASLLVYSHAATTAPTWAWSIGWASAPTDELFGVG